MLKDIVERLHSECAWTCDPSKEIEAIIAVAPAKAGVQTGPEFAGFPLSRE